MHHLFIDQNIRVEVAEALRRDGKHVVHASETGLKHHDDESIFRWCQGQGLTVVTFDSDFAEMAYRSHETHARIVRLRLEPQTPAHVIPILRRFFDAHPPEKLKNALVVLAESKVRLRRW
jgi:predicted nuclease of predicted toxin-antitoxin system